MPDKPQPGKDKDLRSIRHAIADADSIVTLLRSLLDGEKPPGAVEVISEAMLLSIEQYDELNQMLDDAAISAARVIELNRTLRDLLRLLTQEHLTGVARVAVADIIHLLGSQLKLLMVIKDIRGLKTVNEGIPS